MKPSIAPGIRGYGPLGNMILATLLKDAIAGKDDEVQIHEIASACDVSVDQVVDALRKLEHQGAIARSTFDDWSGVGSILVGKPWLMVECCQLSLPEEKPVSPKIKDLLINDLIEFECGGEEPIRPPMIFRAAIVAGQEDDTVELNLIRKLDRAEEDGILDDSVFLSVDGEDGYYAKQIEGRVFGPEHDGFESPRHEAVEYLSDYLLALRPTQSQLLALGLPEPAAEEPPQEEAS